MSTQTTTTQTATAVTFSGIQPTTQQKITTPLQKALQHTPPDKGKGSRPPSGGGGRGSGLPGSGGPGGGQPSAPQQLVQVATDVKAMGSLPQIFTGD